MSQPPPGPVTPAQREIADAIGRMLPLLDPDGARADLAKTPQRVARSLTYLTSGYGQDVRAMLEGATFESDSDEMVLVKDIEVYSLCEHHLLPFFGRAHVAYLPDRRIVGLSKLARVVDVFARRLQVQERMTTQIAAALQETLQPRGVGVLIEAQHLCMMMRGVEKQNSSTTTSCMLGRFRSDPKTRQEFLELVKR